MPIYKYKCEECGYVFTKLMDINDTSEVRCEKCGGRAKKLISSVAVKFNAPGFYSTTVSNKTDKKNNSAKEKTDSSNGKKSESKKGKEK